MFHPPRLYAILDVSCFPDPDACIRVAEQMVSTGITLLQYRNKTGDARQILDHALELKRQLPKSVKLVMNDRADLCVAA